MTQPNVALIGLGTMGAGMAANLLKAGFPLTVYNRTAAKAQPLVDAGATLARTSAEAAARASIVISMLADDAASRAAWTGDQGALPQIAPGTVLIESSTVSPAWIAELSELARGKRAELLDAPVAGSRVQAEGGQLSFLVGGPETALARARPVLQAMSKEILHLGPSGSGAKLKLINNFLAGVQVASLAEALSWIERSGLDRDQALAFLKAGAPGSPLLAGISARMVGHDYGVNFLLELMNKDLNYAQAEASTCGIPLKMAAAAGELFETAIEQGFGQQDMASVIEPLRRR